MTYARLKKLISRGAYDKEDMMNKLDVFLMANRITEVISTPSRYPADIQEWIVFHYGPPVS